MADGSADPSPRETLQRPAFYALGGGGWRDLYTLLHPPYTAWHLSYVLLGAAAAPAIHTGRLVATLAAFFLAVGVAAHALDELEGRPLGTKLSDRALIVMAAVSLGGAVGIGIAGLWVVSATLAPFVLVGAFLVVAYNFELFGGHFHSDLWFALGWGAFPAVTSWWANTLTFTIGRSTVSATLITLACFGLSLAQRRLSTPVRQLRRRTVSVTGEQTLTDGTVIPLTRRHLATPLDGALRTMSWAVVALGAGAVALRL